MAGRIGLIGVPCNSAGTAGGVARAPEALRARGLVDRLGQHVQLTDLGDVSLPPTWSHPLVRDPDSSIIDPEGLATIAEATRGSVAATIGDGLFPLVIGGDCPLL